MTLDLTFNLCKEYTNLLHDEIEYIFDIIKTLDNIADIQQSDVFID